MKFWGIGVSAVGLLAVAGCGGAEAPTESVSLSAVSSSAIDAPAPTSTSTPTPTSTPTSTPAPTLSPTAATTWSPVPTPTGFESYPGELPTEDADSAAIIAGWQEYQRVYEKFAMAPNKYTDYTETQYVTAGHESTVIFDRIDGLRDQELEYVSGRQLRDVTVGTVSANVEGFPTALISYCHDLNEVLLRHSATGYLIQREGSFSEKAHMIQGQDGVWRVEGIESADVEC